MQNGPRVCYANSVSGIRVDFLAASRYTVQASKPSKVKNVLHVFSLVPNVRRVRVALQTDVHGCINRLNSKMSDVIAGHLVIANSGVNFKVPVAWKDTTLYLVAAYNLTKYEEEQATRGQSLLGFLSNLSNFHHSVYSVFISMMFLLLSFLDALTCPEKFAAPLTILDPRQMSAFSVNKLVFVFEARRDRVALHATKKTKLSAVKSNQVSEKNR